MSETMEAQEATRVYPVADEKGRFEESAFEIVRDETGNAALWLLELEAGWLGGPEAFLAEGVLHGRPDGRAYAAFPSRAEAIAHACDVLIAWCGEKKEVGSAKNRKKATVMQDWALMLQRRELNPTAVTVAPAGLTLTEVGAPVVILEESRSAEVSHADPLRAGSAEVGGLQASGPFPVEALQMIPIDDLHESHQNPRQSYPDGPMAELVESMRASGFRQWLPLMVRPRAEGGYEIGAGHRRSRAAREAGITLVPCMVRPMSDVEFLDVLNFDNSNREDVHPLHESAGWRAWMQATGKGVLDIAARIGQSKEYVYQRLKYAALIPEAAEAFLNLAIKPRHAIIIARLQPADQKKALKFATDADWRGNRPSVSMLVDHLRQGAYVELAACPFDRTDRMLVAGAGDCESCPKRGANIPEFELEHDTCTDRACYQQKVTNHLVRIKQSLSETPVEISDTWGAKRKGVIASGGYEVVKKGTAGAVTALVTEGREIGKVLIVKVKKAPAKPVQLSQADRDRQHKERQAKAAAELAIRRKILDAILEKVTALTRADLEGLLLCAAERCAEILCDVAGIKSKAHAGASALEKSVSALNEPMLLRLLVAAPLAGELHAWNTDRPCTELLAAAKRYKVDVIQVRAELEGGARREVPKKPATPKDAIGKLGTLNQPKKKPAPPAKKKSAPKPAVKKPAKGKK